MRVMITGGSGFVGRNLLANFSAADVRLAVRARNAADADCDVSLVGDINSETRWGSTLEGVDCVIHLAARVHIMNPTEADRQRFFETNVLGTAKLAVAAAKAGVRRFILLSSIKVNGESTTESGFRTLDATHPRDEYGISKLQAEQRLFAVARDTQMQAIAIRSPLVYGPGVKANFFRLMSWVYKGIPLPLASVKNQRSLVSVWNLCDLIKQVVDTPSIESGVLMASDGDDLSTPDLIRRLAHSMGKSARLVPIPIFVLRGVGAATGKSAEVARLCGSLTVDISETRRKLNWTPPFSVDEGLARTARWYLNEVKAGRA